MRMSAVLAAALVAACVSPALAEGPGSFARFTNNSYGMVFVDVSYVASDACQTILSMRREAPRGVTIGPRNVPLTVVVGANPAGCGDSRVVRSTGRVPGGLMPDLLEIFFVTPQGHVLKHEKVAIQEG